MSKSTIERSLGVRSDAIVDRWLRFAPPIQELYEKEHALERTRELRLAIFVGLILYNLYNITGLFLLADLIPLALCLRVALVTPVSLGLMWLIGRTRPRRTELLVLGGILNAYLVPVYLFWRSHEPLGLFTFGELFLSIVFANMLLALRFAHAVTFTVSALSATLLAVSTKAGLEPALRYAFDVQIVTACVFALYANYRMERRRCEDYIVALGAKLQASNADAASREFQDLSRTDALTRLPNRRHLEERMEEVLSEPGPLAVMMIDVDHFKLYNDALGHPAGDECLRHVAEALSAVTLTHDGFCARYGGEEFTFLVRASSELGVARCARDLVQSVQALGIVHPARSDGLGVVSVSVGISLRSRDAASTVTDLVAAADRALYDAKRRGRGCYSLEHASDDNVKVS